MNELLYLEKGREKEGEIEGEISLILCRKNGWERERVYWIIDSIFINSQLFLFLYTNKE